MDEIKLYENYLTHVGELSKRVNEDTADRIGESVADMILSVSSNLKKINEDSFLKIKECLIKACEWANLISHVYCAKENCIPSAVGEIISEISYLHAVVIRVKGNKKLKEELSEEIAEILCDLIWDNTIYHEKEYWLTKEKVDSVVNSLTQDNEQEKNNQESDEEKVEKIEKYYSEHLNSNVKWEMLEDMDFDVLGTAFLYGKTVTASLVQRKFGIGYPRAQVILARLEQAGAISEVVDKVRILRTTIEEVEKNRKK